MDRGALDVGVEPLRDQFAKRLQRRYAGTRQLRIAAEHGGQHGVVGQWPRGVEPFVQEGGVADGR
jgi:hypothetical protein